VFSAAYSRYHECNCNIRDVTNPLMFPLSTNWKVDTNLCTPLFVAQAQKKQKSDTRGISNHPIPSARCAYRIAPYACRYPKSKKPRPKNASLYMIKLRLICVGTSEGDNGKERTYYMCVVWMKCEKMLVQESTSIRAVCMKWHREPARVKMHAAKSHKIDNG
jgi:hypothetical protein